MIETTAGKALQRARSEKPDICMLDIGLPEMDGNERARRLHAQPVDSAKLLAVISDIRKP
jgi:CheY-like chemotaxis protein